MDAKAKEEGQLAKPAGRKIRFLVLLLSCLAIFSSCYIMDIPAVLSMQLVEYYAPKYGKDAAEYMYSLMYTIYSLPNIILPLFGGILSDKLGYRKMTMILVGFITLGQMVISIGMSISNFEMMIVGRFIFGIGGESVGITINQLIVCWFQGSELSLAQSLNMSLVRCASILNTFLSPRISEYKSMSASFNFGLLVCAFSFLSTIMLIFTDYKYSSSKSIQEESSEQQEKNNEKNSQLSTWQFIKMMMRKIQKSWSKFPKIFWVITFLMICLYITVLTFNTFSSSVLIDLWLPKDNSIQRNSEIAGEMMSIPYVVSSILFPLFGYLCDKYGQRVRFMQASTFIVLIAFILLPFVYPVATLALLGLSYAVFGAVIWPSVSYIIPQKRLGIAFGVMSSLQNGIMGSMPLVIAFIKVESNSMTVILTFVIISLLSIYLSFVLARIDSQNQVSLNDPDQIKLIRFLEIEELKNKKQHADFEPRNSKFHQDQDDEKLGLVNEQKDELDLNQQCQEDQNQYI